jgi:glutamate/tyrosine decarboxylase-like PLP-dependent enzyme
MASGQGKSLDPTDWAAFRAEAHAALDTCVDHLQSIAQGPARAAPVWRPVPDAVKARFAAPVPREGVPLAALLEECRDIIMSHATGNLHPRFFGWAHGSGTAVGVVAEMIAATLNANCGGRDHGAIYVERQVIAWCREIFGLPETTSGVLTVGTSMASVIAIAAARSRALGAENHDSAGLVAYCSSQVHVALKKAFQLLGFDPRALRIIPAEADFTLSPARLAEAIEADRADGRHPFLVMGSAGTVNTGAFDDLTGLSEIAAREQLWFHIDGAFGAWARIASQPRRGLADGIERADSLAFDFHKWMSVPYDAGCVLIRDGDAHRAAFAEQPDYLARGKALAGGDPWPSDFGIDLSRGFRALKIWMALRHYGLDRLGSMVDKNCATANHLGALVERSKLFALAAPVTLNIVCIRLRDAGDPESDDRLVAAIVERLQLDGTAAPSTTRIGGRLCIRCAILNHRTEAADAELTLRAAEALLAQGAHSAGSVG